MVMATKCGIEAADSKALREAAAVLREVGVKSIGQDQINILTSANEIVQQRLKVGGVSEVEKPRMQDATTRLSAALAGKNFAGLTDVADTMAKYAAKTDAALCNIRVGREDSPSVNRR